MKYYYLHTTCILKAYNLVLASWPSDQDKLLKKINTPVLLKEQNKKSNKAGITISTVWFGSAWCGLVRFGLNAQLSQTLTNLGWDFGG